MHKQGHDIFISYRREGGFETANLITEKLRNAGYSVFFDLENMGSGKFNEQLFNEIDRCKDFILVLPKGGLDRCDDKEDWLRLEIAYAMKHNKNIIPVTLSGFQWTNKLPDDLNSLDKYQAITASNYEFFDASFRKIQSYLKSKKGFTPQRYKLSFLGGAILLLLMVAGLFLWHRNREYQYFANVCISQTGVMSSGMGQINLNLNTASNAYKEWEKFRRKQNNAKPQDMERIVQEFTDWVEYAKMSVVFPKSEQYKLSDADDIILKKHNIQSEEIKALYNLVLQQDAEAVLFYLDLLQQIAQTTSIRDVIDGIAEAIYLFIEYTAKANYYSFLELLNSKSMPSEVYDEFKKWVPKLTNFSDIHYRITVSDAETLGNAFMERAEKELSAAKPMLDILANLLDESPDDIIKYFLKEEIDGLKQYENNEIENEVSDRLQNIIRLSDEVMESQQKLQELETNIEEMIRNIIKNCELSPDDDQYLMWGKIVRIAASMARTSERRREAENMNKGDFEVKYTLTTDEIVREITSRLDQYMRYFPETKNYAPAVKQFYTDIKNGKQKLNGMVVMGTKDNLPHPLFNIGDILLARKGKAVNNVDDYQKANGIPGDDVHTFLRLNANGQLSLHKETMPQTDVLTGFIGLGGED